MILMTLNISINLIIMVMLEDRDHNAYNHDDNHCDIDNDNDNHCDQVLFRDGTSDDPDDSEGSGWTIVDGQSLSSSALT